MQPWHLQSIIPVDLGLALGGLAIGVCFGAIVAATNFCVMGSLSDIANLRDWRRFQAWMLALAVAILGVRLLREGGIVAPETSMYLGPALNWLGALAGGVLLGCGMVLAGGCPGRNLARLGGGDLRSGFTLMVMALFAYMTLGGLLGPGRAALERLSAVDLRAFSLDTQGLGAMIARASGLPPSTADWGGALVIASGLLAFCLMDRAFRTSPTHVASGLGVGACVIAGWAITGLFTDEFAARQMQPGSLSFVRPTADTIDWLERFTATMMPGFGVTSVLGTVLGAYVVRFRRGDLRLQTFTGVADTARTMAGAALMGVGGVTAMGCTIGQGITGASTLALGSFIALGAIIGGGFAGFKVLNVLLERET